MVGNIHDSVGNSNACSSTALLSTCNLRSAWALCMSLIHAVKCPSSADKALLVTCDIVLPSSSSIAFKKSYGSAMNLSALSSWSWSCNNTLVALSISAKTTTIPTTSIIGDRSSTSLLLLQGIPFVRFSMMNVAVTEFGTGLSNCTESVVIGSLLGVTIGPGVQIGPNNRGYNGSFMVSSVPSVHVLGSIFIGNSASGYNGGALLIYSTDNVFITTSKFVNNRGGGALFALNSKHVTINDCIFSGNSGANGGSGGAMLFVMVTTISILRCDMSNNSILGGYGWGGAAYFYAVNSTTITGCTISGNSVTSAGGAMYFDAVNSAMFTGCSIEGNSITGGQNGGGSGGAMYFSAVNSVSFSHCNLTDNSNIGQYGQGGAIYLYTASSIRFMDCRITGNSLSGGSYGVGGALTLYFPSNVVMSRCSFMRNSNSGGNGIGGALYLYSANKMSITHSSFTSNIAGDGGAIYIDVESTFIGMTAVQFVRNVAVSGAGGAVYVASSCSYISFGGPIPIHKTCVGKCDHSLTIVQEPKDQKVVGYYVVFNDIPNNIIPSNLKKCNNAMVGGYLYGYDCTNFYSGGCQGCNYCQNCDTAPGVNGQAPYMFPNNSMTVNFTRDDDPTNGYINLWVFPFSDVGIVFDGNVAATNGGANYIGNSVNNVFVMPGTIFRDNSVNKGSGGAVFLGSLSNKVYLYSTTFSGNHALTNGGAVAFQNLVTSVHFYSCSFVFNSAQLGGSVCFGTGNGNDLSGTGLINVIEFVNLTMLHNNASLDGGAIYANNLNAFSLVSSRMIGNIAGRSGGAVSMNTANTMSITTNVTSFVQNSAGTDGGAVFANATNTINSSDITGITTFSSNKCMGRGGAVAVNAGSTASFNSTTTFDSNYAQRQGGAIAVSASSLMLGISAITFTNNSALSGSALYLMSSSTSSVDLQKGSLILGAGCTNQTTCITPPGYIGRGYITRAHYSKSGSSSGCNTAPTFLYIYKLGFCFEGAVYSLIPSTSGGFPQLFYEYYGM